jgi:hypothetical protein
VNVVICEIYRRQRKTEWFHENLELFERIQEREERRRNEDKANASITEVWCFIVLLMNDD